MALLSLLLRSPDKHSPRGAPEWLRLPGESTALPRVLGPSWTPPTRCHIRPRSISLACKDSLLPRQPALESVRPPQDSGRGHTAGPRRWAPLEPGWPPSRRGLGRREDEAAAYQPEWRTAPGAGRTESRTIDVASPRAPDCPNRFYFLILSVYPIDQGKIYFHVDSPSPSESLEFGRGYRGGRDVPGGPAPRACGAPPPPRGPEGRGQAGAWPVMPPRGPRGRRLPGDHSPPRTPAPLYLGGPSPTKILSVLTSAATLAAPFR